MKATDTPLLDSPMVLPVAQTMNWRTIVGLLAAIVAAAFGAGAGAGQLAGPPPPAPSVAQVDSLVGVNLARSRVVERLERLERATVITECVALQQIKNQPIDGCAYLLARQDGGS